MTAVFAYEFVDVFAFEVFVAVFQALKFFFFYLGFFEFATAERACVFVGHGFEWCWLVLKFMELCGRGG